MKQYLLSVHTVEGSPPRTPEEQQNAYRCVSEFNADLQTAGACVRGHEKVPGYGHLRSSLVATKVPAFGHEKSPPLTEVST